MSIVQQSKIIKIYFNIWLRKAKTNPQRINKYSLAKEKTKYTIAVSDLVTYRFILYSLFCIDRPSLVYSPLLFTFKPKRQSSALL